MDFWFSLELNGIHSRKVKERRGNFFLFLSSVVAFGGVQFGCYEILPSSVNGWGMILCGWVAGEIGIGVSLIGCFFNSSVI